MAYFIAVGTYMDHDYCTPSTSRSYQTTSTAQIKTPKFKKGKLLYPISLNCNSNVKENKTFYKYIVIN